jgi:NAD+ diphosphatase
MADVTRDVFERAAHHRSDVAFLEAELEAPRTLLLPMWRGQVLLRDRTLLLLRLGDAPDARRLIDECVELVWLGLLDGVSCFALDLSKLPAPDAAAALSGSEPSEVRPLILRLSAAELELSLYARALLLWHSRHQFCAVSGHPSRPRQGGHQRVCSDSACAAEHFPRTDPCVLMLVCDGERCLLGRSRGWPNGMHSALAGFVEPGETLEQAVAREVMEEVGIELGAVRYVSSQPWPFPASLMIGFIAEARTIEIHIDEHELEAARWVTREQLRDPGAHGFFVPPPAALAGQLIAAFAAGTLIAPSSPSP